MRNRENTIMSEQQFLYFAYGSNMLSARLKAPDRAPSARPRATGYLPGHRLDFSKDGADHSGKCDIPETGNSDDRVHGVLYAIDQRHRPALDRVEELGFGYRDAVVPVRTAAGTVQALTYIARRRKADILPFDWYKAITIAGALEHGLPADYVGWLRTFDSMTDPDPERSKLHRKILGHNFATFDR